MTNLSLASSKQISFIDTLIKERVVAPALIDTINGLSSQSDFSTRDASNIINALKILPYRPKTVPAVTPIQDVLAKIPSGYYAVPRDEINAVLSSIQINNDLAFFGTRTYKGRHYLDRLSGSVGDFVRYRLSPQDSLAVAQYLASDPLRFTQIFGKHFARCGKCAAPLTDEASREVSLGPVCRKAFGI